MNPFKRFVDNKPGRNWVKCFLKRHPNLTIRTANLIKRTRAAVDHKENILTINKNNEILIPQNILEKLST